VPSSGNEVARLFSGLQRRNKPDYIAELLFFILIIGSPGWSVTSMLAVCVDENRELGDKNNSGAS
jgi:hypothetical protein